VGSRKGNHYTPNMRLVSGGMGGFLPEKNIAGPGTVEKEGRRLEGLWLFVTSSVRGTRSEDDGAKRGKERENPRTIKQEFSNAISVSAGGGSLEASFEKGQYTVQERGSQVKELLWRAR